ncbi:hypothetical protein PIB30_063412 [Stylosanthes scabra]|uniref:Uncharacterized protein n=1 Tax=Stylosanthes scabra TaxID=79078 RepID=A0ABU6SMD8_9FABA|nr:hypothetical protein [Stylosanthes scabra]
MAAAMDSPPLISVVEVETMAFFMGLNLAAQRGNSLKQIKGRSILLDCTKR